MEFNHISVLLNEVVKNANIHKDSIFVDCTLGGAGHSKEILKILTNGKIIGIDRDIVALNEAKKRLIDLKDELKSSTELIFFHDNFNNIKKIFEENNIEKPDTIFMDLGISSYQIDTPERGFSYMHNGNLDMRMNQEDLLTAKEVVNNYSEKELSKIFWIYGEEKYAKQIAREIVRRREEKEISTTFELVDIIDKVKPFSKKGGHKAKKVFQSLRIEVNSELNNLSQTVKDSVELLNSGGRLLVITFHSLEDKIVKKAMQDLEEGCICPKDLPFCVCGKKPVGMREPKKAILPSEEECLENSRSRSAKLRIFVKGDSDGTK